MYYTIKINLKEARAQARRVDKIINFQYDEFNENSPSRCGGLHNFDFCILIFSRYGSR